MHLQYTKQHPSKPQTMCLKSPSTRFQQFLCTCLHASTLSCGLLTLCALAPSHFSQQSSALSSLLTIVVSVPMCCPLFFPRYLSMLQPHLCPLTTHVYFFYHGLRLDSPIRAPSCRDMIMMIGYLNLN